MKMKNKKVSSLSVMTYFFKIAFKTRPSYPFLILFTILINAVQPFLSIIFPTLIIEELTKVTTNNFNLSYIILLVATFTLSEFTLSALRSIMWHFMSYNENMVNKEWKKIMGDKMMKMRYQHLENPEVLDQISKGQDGLFGYGNRLGGFQALITNFINIVSSVISLIGIIYIIAQLNILLVIILLALIALKLLLQNKNKKLNIKEWEERKRINRENDYYSSLISDFKYGKDIRLYHCSELLLSKNEEYLNDTYKYRRKMYKKYKLYGFLMILLDTISHLLTYGYVALYFIKGLITSISMYSLYVNSINKFINFSHSIFNSFLNVNQNTKMMYEFKKFMEIDTTYVEGTKKVDLNNKLEIEFKNVSFKYPNSDIFVLKNVNIKINPLKKYSIVGENGAGKTTFIKLLMRLYDPSEGVITLNGIDIKEFDIESYYQIFGVVFQDYQLIGFTLGENITSSDTFDENKVNNILKDINFKAKTQNLATSMLKYFDEKGVELSGGENQKVAIARALYKDSNILILDEPTAALDPLAEYEIYNQFDSMTNNKTALYISHRLSSCRFCDEIIVFDKGKIIEKGHHDILINNIDGKYYSMFKAQAKYYQDNNVYEIIKGVNLN